MLLGLEGAVRGVFAAPAAMAALRAFARLRLRVINDDEVGGFAGVDRQHSDVVGEDDGDGLGELNSEHFERSVCLGTGMRISCKGAKRRMRENEDDPKWLKGER